MLDCSQMLPEWFLLSLDFSQVFDEFSRVQLILSFVDLNALRDEISSRGHPLNLGLNRCRDWGLFVSNRRGL